MLKKINILKIDDFQLSLIKKALVDYLFIEKNWISNSVFFKYTFSNFYLKARRLSKDQKNKYFSLLNTNLPKDINFVLNKLRKITNKWDLSIASKLLHTIYPNDFPIIDSKIRKYLNEIYSVKIQNTWKTCNQALNDYKKVLKWYSCEKNNNKSLIKWFDKIFCNYKSISNLKKIDTLIFTWVIKEQIE